MTDKEKLQAIKNSVVDIRAQHYNSYTKPYSYCKLEQLLKEQYIEGLDRALDEIFNYTDDQ